MAYGQCEIFTFFEVKDKLISNLWILFHALQRLTEEDPTLKVERNSQTGELLISGLGQVHFRLQNLGWISGCGQKGFLLISFITE